MSDNVDSESESISNRLSGRLYDELDVSDPYEKIDRLLEVEYAVEEFDHEGPKSVAIAYPDIYPNGISNTGHQTVYRHVNRRPSWYATRTYEPDEHLKRRLAEDDQPYFTWEDRKPLGDHDVIMFSLSFEELAPNMLSILDHSDVPIWSAYRTDEDPLVICGGPTPNYNPEPYAHFVDCFYVGAAEVGVTTMLDAYDDVDGPETTRREYLKRLAQEEGCYVPEFYHVEYGEHGELTRFEPREPEAKRTISKTRAENVSEDPSYTFFVTPHNHQEKTRFTVEVGRGCAYSCNFCQLGNNYRPKWVDVDDLRDLVEDAAIGHTESLYFIYEASPGDYIMDVYELFDELYEKYGIDVHHGAFTANQANEKVIEIVSKCGPDRLIVAPEAASGEMRSVVGKEGFYEDEEVFETARLCAKYGIPDFGLYLLTGLPGETNEHVREMADLIAETREHMNQDGVLEAHVNPAFPKPQTPFQWAAMQRPEDGREKMAILIEALQEKGLTLELDDISKSVIGYGGFREVVEEADDDVDVVVRSIVGSKMHYTQPIMARGDRRLGDVIYDAYRDGNDVDAWKAALDRYDIDDEIFFRERAEDERLPWSHIQNSMRDSQRLGTWQNVKGIVSDD